MRMLVDTEAGLERVQTMDADLKEAERRNQELVREVKTLQKIQNDQSKALEKISNTNEYSSKLKTLLD